MGKWTSEVFSPGEPTEGSGHPSDEALASLADGSMDASTRQQLVSHINRCDECYRVFSMTLRDMASDENPSWWKKPKWVALAASVLIVFSLSLYIGSRQAPTSQVRQVTLSLDRELRDLLIESHAVQWESGELTNRLAGLLKKRGVRVGALKRVVLARPYYPTRGIFPPKELLTIRIENGTAFIEVVEEPK